MKGAIKNVYSIVFLVILHPVQHPHTECKYAIESKILKKPSHTFYSFHQEDFWKANSEIWHKWGLGFLGTDRKTAELLKESPRNSKLLLWEILNLSGFFGQVVFFHQYSSEKEKDHHCLLKCAVAVSIDRFSIAFLNSHQIWNVHGWEKTPADEIVYENIERYFL